MPIRAPRKSPASLLKETMSSSATLSPRYEIRLLGPEHIDWVLAILCHSNTFHSPLWPIIYPENKTQRCYAVFKAAHYIVAHQIESGLSWGVFDKEWKPKNPEAAATGGKNLWDLSNEAASSDDLLAQMDFPLVSIGLSYDSINPLDAAQMVELTATLPAFGLVYMGLANGDKRDPKAWQATEAGQVLFRNATSTRRDYEGQGTMKALAHHIMNDAAKRGFRGIQIETINDAVSHVWRNPPSPYKGELVSKITPDTFEYTDEQGNKSYPLQPSKQECDKVYVHLK